MTFDQVINAVSGKVICHGDHFSNQEILKVIACDLMSDLLVTEEDEVLLVTSLPSEQTARTADMVGACGIVLVNGKEPQASLVEMCGKLKLPLIRTDLDSFRVSWRLGCLLFGKS